MQQLQSPWNLTSAAVNYSQLQKCCSSLVFSSSKFWILSHFWCGKLLPLIHICFQDVTRQNGFCYCLCRLSSEKHSLMSPMSPHVHFLKVCSELCKNRQRWTRKKINLLRCVLPWADCRNLNKRLFTYHWYWVTDLPVHWSEVAISSHCNGFDGVTNNIWRCH